MVSKADKARADKGDSAGEVDPGVLASFIGYAMKRAYMTIHTDFLASLEHLGLRPGTFSALTIIVDNPDISQSQLARALAIERSGVVLIVDHLEGRELIGRHRVPGDRRAYALRATLAGRRLRDAAVEAIRRHEARVLASLSEEEQAALRGLLARVI
ncbi:DNA-binding MarR family transcriptional regulator [Breoghania corrubedonensis]|uniref:DNA-binding MarR family transcriptional regulator n=1 Tax=Breoghania corrubedonensis TaxID=665038 RepID=A0A2T5UN68_9HYPH|nr:MarR family transcriptional regulator [Breoghania corrubedonensis]PTW52945.1 DNA-binding MarR family transcriptional regulator [Breoghania corrubedonensis]